MGAFDYDHPCAQTPHTKAVGVQESHAAEPFVNSPILAYDWMRNTDGSGNPLWVNRGTLGSAGDAIAPGGAANPTALGDLPGYSFDGGDRMPLSVTRTGDWSLAIWGRSSNSGALYHPVVGLSGLWAYLAWGGTGWSNHATLNVAGTDLESVTSVTDGIPHQVVLTRSVGDYTISVDGVVENSSTTTSVDIDNLNLGCRGNEDLFYTGDLYSVSIYDRAISAVEIAALYESHRHIFGV